MTEHRIDARGDALLPPYLPHIYTIVSSNMGRARLVDYGTVSRG